MDCVWVVCVWLCPFLRFRCAYEPAVAFFPFDFFLPFNFSFLFRNAKTKTKNYISYIFAVSWHWSKKNEVNKKHYSHRISAWRRSKSERKGSARISTNNKVEKSMWTSSRKKRSYLHAFPISQRLYCIQPQWLNGVKKSTHSRWIAQSWMNNNTIEFATSHRWIILHT